jgi:hypothetical protein
LCAGIACNSETESSVEPLHVGPESSPFSLLNADTLSDLLPVMPFDLDA